MPFDPRILRPDEPPLDENGELVLEGKLAELAGQLRDDAVRLAEVYPPSALRQVSVDNSSVEGSPDVSPLPAHSRHARFVVPAAAIVLLAVSAIALRVAQQQWPVKAPGERYASTAEPQTDHETFIQAESTSTDIESRLVAQEVHEDVGSPALPPAASSPARASTSLFLHDYSGPELEGLFDLLEEQQDDGTISL